MSKTLVETDDRMPFRFYEDHYKGKESLYEQYFLQLLKAYEDIEKTFQHERFVKRGEDGKIQSVDMVAIIEDCRKHDDELIGVSENGEKQKGDFAEELYGISGFLDRYTDINTGKKSTGTLDHKEVGKKAFENLMEMIETVDISILEKKDNELTPEQIVLKKEASDLMSNLVAFAHMSTGYIPRPTIITSAQMIAKGAMMQIGCSQGKTTVLAFASYLAMKKGQKVMNTSSNPGLVLDNFNEFCDPYDALGVSQDMCAITRDDKGTDMIVLREKVKGDDGKEYGVTVQIKEDGTVVLPEFLKPPQKPEEPKKPKKREKSTEETDEQYKKFLEEEYPKVLEKYEKDLAKYKKDLAKYSEKLETWKKRKPEVEKIYIEKKEKFFAERFNGKESFEDRVTEMLKSKPLAMADTMTLMKYEKSLDALEKSEIGDIKDSICMCDEADCEFLDARPYEITGKEYSQKAQDIRFSKRRQADKIIAGRMQDENFIGSMEILKQISKELGIPLEFLKDAYDVRSSLTKEGEDYVIDENGNLTSLNVTKRVLEKDTQGHEQAIYAMRANQGKKDIIPKEKEVLDVKYPYQVIGKYTVQSLISGTMEDRGLSQFKDSTPSLYKRFAKVREELFKTMGFTTPETESVINFRTIGPLTREDKGMVMSSDEEQKVEGQDQKLVSDKKFSLPEGMSWEEYIIKNADNLEDKWRNSVDAEIARRKVTQPVLVSVPNADFAYDKLGANKEDVFTDAYKPDKYKVKDKVTMTAGAVAYMDDAYGRGYNMIFGKDPGGHVIITTLPENSRNLEQFLFRVARGGDAGSSSMIINPTDPKLIEFLTTMDKNIQDGLIDLEQYKDLFDQKTWESIEANPQSLTNTYFTKLMQGEISMDRLVFDMYPEQTMKIMENMTKANEYIYDTKLEIFATLATLEFSELANSEVVKYMELALNKSRAKHIKIYSGEDVVTSYTQIRKEAAINVALALAKNGKTVDKNLFLELMPKELEEVELDNIFKQLKIRSEYIQDSILEEQVQDSKSSQIVEFVQDNIEQAITDYEIEVDDVLNAARDANQIGKDESIKSSDEIQID